MGLMRFLPGEMARRALAVGVFASEDAFSGAYDAFESSTAHVYEPARRVLSSYSHLDPLMCVRRDSDDAEDCFLSVSETNPELNKANVASFLGGGSGYYYWVADQAGGDHLTQATAAAQPLYVASAQNGHAGMEFDGDNDALKGAFTNGGALSQPFDVFTVSQLDASIVGGGNFAWICDGDDDSDRVILGQRVGTNEKWEAYSGTLITGDNADGSVTLWSFFANGASSQFWINRASQANGDAGADNPDGIVLGSNYAQSARFWKGPILSFAIADPALSTTDREGMETAINDYWGIF